jgi:hypothetical protein
MAPVLLGCEAPLRAVAGDGAQAMDVRAGPSRQSGARWAARGAAAFCAAFAGLQIALAAGAPLGEVVWGGSSAVLPAPMRLASAGAAAYLALASAALLARAGDWGRQLPAAPFRWFAGFLTLQLALNTAANLAARSPVERYGMGAASALGALLCLAAFIGPSRRRD